MSPAEDALIVAQGIVDRHLAQLCYELEHAAQHGAFPLHNNRQALMHTLAYALRPVTAQTHQLARVMVEGAAVRHVMREYILGGISESIDVRERQEARRGG